MPKIVSKKKRKKARTEVTPSKLGEFIIRNVPQKSNRSVINPNKIYKKKAFKI